MDQRTFIINPFIKKRREYVSNITQIDYLNGRYSPQCLKKWKSIKKVRTKNRHYTKENLMHSGGIT